MYDWFDKILEGELLKVDKGTIVYIGGFELPDKNAAAHRVLSNGKIMMELGYKVVFIDVDKGIQYDEEIMNTKRNIQGFECWSIPYPQSNKQWIHYLSNIKSFIKVLNQYTDVRAIICYNYQSLAFMKIKRHCNENKIKILADCTEWYSTKGNNILFKIIKGLDSYIRMRIIQKKLDGIIVISRYLEKYYGSCKNLIYIPPLVDLSEEKWSLAVPENKREKILIVYAGGPGRHKDKLDLVIEELYKLSKVCEYEFYVVGITREQYIGNFRNHRLILEELHGKVIFLGRLTHIESLMYVKKADFTMFFRDNNRMTKAGFPTKFVESVSCGTPVITSKTSDIVEYMVEGKHGYFIDVEKRENVTLNLKKILGKEYCEGNGMEESYINAMFHYGNYIEQIREFLKKI